MEITIESAASWTNTRSRVELQYESYDFKSIPEIPFEWLLLFNIYPKVNWKIAGQLKAQVSTSQEFQQIFHTIYLNERTGDYSFKSFDWPFWSPANLLTRAVVAWEGLWPVSSALSPPGPHCVPQLGITQFYLNLKTLEWNCGDGSHPQYSANTE